MTAVAPSDWRLATVLHDHLQQLLAAAKMRLGLLRPEAPLVAGLVDRLEAGVLGLVAIVAALVGLVLVAEAVGQLAGVEVELLLRELHALRIHIPPFAPALQQVRRQERAHGALVLGRGQQVGLERVVSGPVIVGGSRSGRQPAQAVLFAISAFFVVKSGFLGPISSTAKNAKNTKGKKIAAFFVVFAFFAVNSAIGTRKPKSENRKPKAQNRL